MKCFLMLLLLNPRAVSDEVGSEKEIRADDGDHADEVLGAHGYEGGPERLAVGDEAVCDPEDEAAELRGKLFGVHLEWMLADVEVMLGELFNGDGTLKVEIEVNRSWCGAAGRMVGPRQAQCNNLSPVCSYFRNLSSNGARTSNPSKRISKEGLK